MRLNRFLRTVVLFSFVVSCQNDEGKLVLTPSRTVASMSATSCFKDQYSVENLKKEIEILETSYQGLPPVRGNWKHLNLEALPVPQANFLIKYGSSIGDRHDPESIDYSGCEDVPCLFNRIYGKVDHEVGYVHYLWYLKFGNLLAADNFIPGQKSPQAGIYQNKQFQLSDYLFSEKEIYAFWRLIETLPHVYQKTSFLEEIQRLPPGAWHEENDKRICGVASRAGFILLMDECLKLDERGEAGFFYLAVPHEIGHHIDTAKGSELPIPSSHFSKTEEYLKVSGLKKIEFFDDKGELQIQYEVLPDAKFITSYAMKSPVETFADTIASYRYYAERSKALITPEHYQFFKSTFHGGEEFTTSSTLKRWVEKNRKKSLELMIDKYFECRAGSQNFESCVAAHKNKIKELITLNVKNFEPEGCTVLENDSKKDAWNKELRLLIENSYATVTNQKWSSDYSLEKLRLEAREKYLTCQGENSPQLCFENSLFNNYYSYSELENEVSSFYKNVVNSHLQLVRKNARQLWDQCKAPGPDDASMPEGNYFSLRQGYMVSSLYNCINLQFERSLSLMMSSLSVETSSAKKLIKNFLSKNLNDELNKIHPLEVLKEKESAQQVSLSFVGRESELTATLLKDSKWLQVGGLVQGCREAVLQKIPFSPFFGFKKDLFKNLLDKINCSAVLDRTEMKDWILLHQNTLRDQVFSLFQERMQSGGYNLSKDCLHSTEEKFETCFSQGWDALEEEESYRSSRVDVAFRLKITQAELLTYAKSQRSTWQRDVQ